MKKPFQVWEDIYTIGGPDLSGPDDCSVYLIGGPCPAMIDTGAGGSFSKLVQNIESLGFRPEKLAAIILTHAHIDHIGAAHRFQSEFNTPIVAHELDAEAIETGTGTFAEAYGVVYHPCKITQRIEESQESLYVGDREFKIVHIPGHTLGSIAVYLDIAGRRVLFGQDVHGPYNPQWGADIPQAVASLQRLIDLKADILCEGHLGIYEPADEVKAYIRRYLRMLQDR